MKNFTFCILWTMIAASAFAQRLSPTVGPATGGYSTASSINLSWTMGETVIPTLTAGSSTILTEGFQQPEIQIYTNTLSSNTYVQGAALSVPFTALGFYSTANVFTAQLSDASGSFASPVNIGTHMSNASGSIAASIPMSTPVASGYRIRVVSSAPAFTGTDNGSNISVTGAYNIWTGALSNAWATAGNWTISVPSPTINALIPGGLSRYPEVTGNGYSVDTIKIQAGASLTIPSGVTLSAYGNWTDSGTASVGTGAVALRGSNMTLSGTTAFGYLTVAGTAAVGPNAGDMISVSDILVKSSGNLNTNNKLTLISTSAQTALIADSGGSLTGSAYVERYNANASAFSEISSPLSGATVSNISGMTISGTNGAGSFVSGKEGTLQEYLEPANTTSSLDSGYYNYTSLSDTLTSGLGLAAYISTGTAISFYGPPALGNISYNITKLGPNPTTAGWDLIGNPYPSPMSWTELKNANPAVMNATCYIWKPTSASAGSWEAYNGGASIGSATDVIALGQGFFVLKNSMGTTALTFTNTQRIYSLTPPFYKTGLLPDEIRLTLSEGIDTAEILSYTQPGMTPGYDVDADGPMPPFVPGTMSDGFAFVSEGQPYLIDVFDHITENLEIPLTIHAARAATYTIDATAVNVEMYPVYILDKMTNTYYTQPEQSVTFTSQGNEDITGRYSVVFDKKDDANNTANTIKIYSKPATIVIERTGSDVPAAVRVTNLIGQQIVNTVIDGARLEIPMTQIDAAIYLVYVGEPGHDYVTKKVFVLNYK